MSDSSLVSDSSVFLRWYRASILSHPWLVILVLGLITVFMGFQARHYKVDASADSLVLEGDKDLEFFREIGKRYASEEYLVIAYQPKQSLLLDASLAALAELVENLKGIEGVSSVMSILDVPLLYSPKISITELTADIRTLRDDDIDKSQVAIELQESPIYKQLLTSGDGKTTAIQVNLRRDYEYIRLLEARDALRDIGREGSLTDEQQRQLQDAETAFKAYATEAAERMQKLVAHVRAVLGNHQQHASQIFLGGVPMIASDLVAFVKSDLETFGLGILAFIVGLLFVIFRSLRWVLLPLFACVIANVFMLGLLGLLDWRMTVISSNFVALLLIITLAISVHLVVRYRELQLSNPDASAPDLALASVALMIRPCLYTGLTTIVAFMSLVISGIRPVIDFGWMMTIGVVVALLVTFLIVPVGMSIGGASRSGEQSKKGGAFTLRFAVITEKYGAWVLGVATLVLVFSVSGVMQLKVENRFIDYFDASTEIYQGMELIDSELGGTIPLDIVLFPADVSAADPELVDEEFDDEFGDEFDDFSDEFSSDTTVGSQWFTLAGLNEIQKIHDHVDALSETGKVLSLATVYKVAGDLLGGGLDDIQLTLAYNKLPGAIKDVMIAPYLDVDSDETRIAIRVKETSRELNRAELLESLRVFMEDEMGYSEDRYRFTGMLVLYNNMLQSLFKSQILTLGLVFVAITAMMAVLFSSLKLAIIGVIPNLMAAMLVLGGMGWAGVPLDMMTITIAAISIGIGVDDTIHYIHRFKSEFPNDRNYLATMYRCHESIGRAMYYTSVIIIFGFSILALSNFKPSIYFGLLTGVAMFSALLGALMLLPKLLLVFKPLGKESVS